MTKLKRRKEQTIDKTRTKIENKIDDKVENEEDIPIAEKVIIAPIGYPIKLKNDYDTNEIVIEDLDLFATYAAEQWNDIIVNEDTYLFDRFAVPDFAFKVIKVVPNNSRIKPSTKIIVKSPKQKVKKIKYNISFDDIIGHKKVKEKAKLIIEYLKHPKIFGEWGPHAVLFYGEPGTGKTMMVKAIASAANASIFFEKATDLIGTHVGDGSRRISNLFKKAIEQKPSIIFIDELDAIGLTRNFQSIRGDVSEVVTALLSSIDMIKEVPGVVVIGTTNALYLLDKALLSRFETHFKFNLPNYDERLEMLKMYSSRLPIRCDFTLERVAKLTKGFSGRDIKERLLKTALHIAIVRNRKEIDDELIDEVLKGLIRDIKKNSYYV